MIALCLAMSVPVMAALALVSAAFALTFVRLLLGPGLPDRVVALDLLGVLAVGFVAVYGIHSGQPILLDAATVLALVGFVATVSVARWYLEKGSRDVGNR